MSFKKTTEIDFLGRSEEFILDEETGKKFRRVIGGFGWPSGFKPGCSVIVAEDRGEDKLFNKRHYQILSEYQNGSPSKLIRRTAEFNSYYKTHLWVGDTSNRAMMEFFNNCQRRFYLMDAPFFDDKNGFQAYLLRIKEHTSATEKTLHFGEKSNLPALLTEITTQDISQTVAISISPYKRA